MIEILKTEIENWVTAYNNARKTRDKQSSVYWLGYWDGKCSTYIDIIGDIVDQQGWDFELSEDGTLKIIY